MFKVSREWTRTVSIADEKIDVQANGIAAGPSWFNIRSSVERHLQRTYSSEKQTKQQFAEEITVTVPERTDVHLVLNWKRIWQRGTVRVIHADGAVYTVPYQAIVNITFDQYQEDV